MSNGLHTIDPADPDVTDLAALDDIIGGARVVCLGESAHAISEYQHIKDRLFRYLASELGFTTLVIESGLAEGLAIDAWLHGEPDTVERVSRDGTTFEFWDVEPFRDQLRWMRERNARGHETRIYGMDVPGSAVDPAAAVRVCLGRLEPRTSDDTLRALAELGGRYAATRRWAALGADGRRDLRHGAAELAERAAAEGDELARLCATGASLALTTLSDGPGGGAAHSTRDQMMADTVRWILTREDRIVISAHNAHVARASLFGVPSMGTLLAAELGADMVVIGTTRTAGSVPTLEPATDDPLRPVRASTATVPIPPAHTLDAAMDAAGPLHLTDLRRLPPGTLDGISAIAMQTLTQDLDPTAFDALVHVRDINPVPGIVARTQAAIDRAALHAADGD